jgi:hypothetical protein
LGGHELSIQDLAAIGELLGFVAVIGTLVYLSIQTRQARLASERNATVALIAAHARWREALYQNPDLADLLAKANAGQPISDGAEIQLRYLHFELFVACVLGFYTADPDSPRADPDYLIDILRANPNVAREWKRQRHIVQRLSPDLVAVVDSSMQAADNQQKEGV